MVEPWVFPVMTMVAFVTGFIAAIAGGGGLIMMPALLFCGVPPLRAGQLSLLLGEAVTAQPEVAPPPSPPREPAEDEVLLRLRSVEPDELSPRAALDLVSALCSTLRRAG